jgi:hypothetical protein
VEQAFMPAIIASNQPALAAEVSDSPQQPQFFSGEKD